MNNYNVFLLLLLFGSPVFAQVESTEPGADTNDPVELVAKLKGVDVAWEFRSRPGPRSEGGLAAVKLIELKEQAIPALSAAIESDDSDIRRNAAYLLGYIQLPGCIEPLIHASSDASPKVRATAIDGLPAYGDQAARQTLIKALSDQDSDVRNAAIWAFRPPVGDARPNNAVRFATANVLIPLLDDSATQYAAAEVLGRLDSNVACQPLLKLLESEETAIQVVAVEALGQLKDTQATMPLLAMLDNTDLSLRHSTTEALGELGDLRATPRLVSLLADDRWSVRRYAAVALGKIADLRAAPSLIRLLKDQESQVGYAAAEALGRIGDPGATDPLVDYILNVKRSDHARPAIDALRQIRHPDAVAALVKVSLGSDNQHVRRNSRFALGNMVGHSLWSSTDEDVRQWWEANREGYERDVPE